MSSVKSKSLDKEMELLEAASAEGKAGVKAAKEKFKEEEKFKQEQTEIKRTVLKEKKKRRDYLVFLGKLLLNELGKLTWPTGWKYQVAPDPVGIIMEIETSEHKFFRIAFKATGLDFYDINAVDNFSKRAQHLIDTKTDIWLT